MSWKTAKTAKRCNALPDVWAAIAGCTGTGRAYRYAPAHFGVSRPEYACPACRAFCEASDALRGPAHAAYLEAARERAGVADYRTAEVVRVDGCPRLTGKVDVHAAREAALDALYGFTGGNDAAHAARALRVLAGAGGDCKAVVAAAKLTPSMLATLRAAYRSTAA